MDPNWKLRIGTVVLLIALVLSGSRFTRQILTLDRRVIYVMFPSGADPRFGRHLPSTPPPKGAKPRAVEGLQSGRRC